MVMCCDIRWTEDIDTWGEVPDEEAWVRPL